LSFDFCAIILKHIQDKLESLNSGLGPGGLNRNAVYNIEIPLPPEEIQKKIGAEIEALEKTGEKSKKMIARLEQDIRDIIASNKSYELVKISQIADKLFAGGDLPEGQYSREKTDKYNVPIFANAVERDGLYGFTDIISDITCSRNLTSSLRVLS
jgi:hypothetical protein